MKSLFLKIFLSFWIAHALFLAFAIIVTVATRPARGTWDALGARALNESVQALERGGADQARAYLDDFERDQHIHVFLLNAAGEEVTGRHLPPWARDMARGSFRPDFPWNLFPSRFVTQSATTAEGHRYTVLMELPPGPRVFMGPHGFPHAGLLIWILTSGLVCYLLAYYLTAPVSRLRAATQRLSAGDLTARAGAPLMRRRDEIGELVRDFDAMAERLETLVNAQSRLLNDVSHELRSPLARLNVALGLARQRTSPDAQGALDRIEREAERLNELIGQLLTIARLESGEDSVEQSPVKLADLIREIAKDAEFEAQGRNCQVRVQIADECLVTGSRSLLHSALENVVRNGTRYTREGTEVVIELSRKGVDPAGDPKTADGEALIRVLDCGSGVPEDAVEKIFRPFYRLDDARNRQTGGVGLGLAITERTVRLHGGTVTARNRPEGGLAIEIRLPLAATAASVETPAGVHA